MDMDISMYLYCRRKGVSQGRSEQEVKERRTWSETLIRQDQIKE